MDDSELRDDAASHDHEGPQDQAGPEDDAHEPPELDHDGQLAELLGAPDRDRCPGARPVVSVTENDDSAFVEEINAHCVAAPALERRGSFHGHLAELDDSLTFVPRDPMAVIAKRWALSRPIVLHDALPDSALDAAEDDEIGTERWGPMLRHAEGLDAFLRHRAEDLVSEFAVIPDAELESALDDERDLARRSIVHDREHRLWVKSQRLSTFDGDESVRLRLSFGEEGDDDANRDPVRHRSVSRLAMRLFPEAEAIQRDPELTGVVADWIGGPAVFTQAIAYWNAPNGGALFHHDAFHEPKIGRQRGVLYAQLTGSTVWLALSNEDLATRVLEFMQLMRDGTFTAIRQHLFPKRGDFDALYAKVKDPVWTKKEVVAPGCGELAAVCNQGPEFTALLADAGHAYVVSAGDVILLPNHGLSSTCMHSVFCGGEETGFSLSLAIRDRGGPGAGSRASSGSGRRRRGGRGRGGARRRGGARGGSRGGSNRGPRSSRRRG